MFHPPQAHPSYPEPLGKYLSLLLPRQWTLGQRTAPIKIERHFLPVRHERHCFLHTFTRTILVYFRHKLVMEREYLHSGFLPLAFSRQPLWSWLSRVPVPYIPVICSQLESSCPQTRFLFSNTLPAESHNPGLRTSPHACWCRCLAPSAAGEPVDLPWMSSSAKKCVKMLPEPSLIDLWADLPTVQHKPDVPLCRPHLCRWHRWGSPGD